MCPGGLPGSRPAFVSPSRLGLLPDTTAGNCKVIASGALSKSASCEERRPMPVALEHFIRLEAAFVLERPAAFDVVTEIDVRDPGHARCLDRRQHVERPERSVTLFRLVEEVNQRQAIRHAIDIATADQSTIQTVLPLLCREWIDDEHIVVVA